MANDLVTSITSVIGTFAGDLKAVIIYAVGVGLGIYAFTWGIKYVKKQITKNAKQA
jgi:hypothetical protein